MKAHVYVTLKTTVLDAQGQTVAGALKRMNYRGIRDVRQGKYFLLTLAEPEPGADPAATEVAARAEIDRIAREVLVNPVIEEYTFRLEA
jgi:phosphoribosylformylglycinamidine synthase